MQLVKVDDIGLQPAQGGLDRRADNLAVVAFAIADKAGIWACHLGGDLHVAPAPRRDPVADDFLRAARRLFGDRVDRIHLGGVEKIDPGLERHVNLAVGIVLRCLVAVCHGAKAPRRNGHPGPAKRNLFHEASLKVGFG